MKYDVVSLGELLIDFTNNGLSKQGNPVFEANPGGAPCNVLAMLSKLNKKTAFIGKVGNDMFANILKKTLKELQIDSSAVIGDDTVNTTLAFVHHSSDGDRKFSFFRNPGADTMLNNQNIDDSLNLITDCRIFHFGSLSLSHQPSRDATKYAVENARRAGALISFDPNLRPLLWHEEKDAKEQIHWGCSHCDILKMADSELEFISEKSDIYGGAQYLKETFPNVKIIFITKGKMGAECFYRGDCYSCESYLDVKTIDTTGAGDTFCGFCLGCILNIGLEDFTQDTILTMIRMACAAASLVTTRQGALCSMPSYEEIEKLYKNTIYSIS